VNKVYLDENGIIEIEVVGDQTAASVHAMGEEIQALILKLEQASKPVLLLDNLKRMGDTTPEARSEVGRLAKTLRFDRGAMVGDGSVMMRSGTNLMLRAIGRSNLRYFASRDAALMWLGVDPS
jgi:UDP-N-acetylmuramyl pentapeptide synthase